MNNNIISKFWDLPNGIRLFPTVQSEESFEIKITNEQYDLIDEVKTSCGCIRYTPKAITEGDQLKGWRLRFVYTDGYKPENLKGKEYLQRNYTITLSMEDGKSEMTNHPKLGPLVRVVNFDKTKVVIPVEVYTMPAK